MRRARGQSMVEFAILAPVLFVLLLASIDLGRAVYIYNSISDAAREGTRAAIPFDSPLPSSGTVVTAVQSKLGGGFGLSTDPCAGQPVSGTCPTTPTSPNSGYIWFSSGIGAYGRQPVTVKISFRFQPWIPVVRDAAGNGVVITAESTMVTEY